MSRWAMAVGVLAVGGCYQPIGNRCGEGLPPCPQSQVCVSEICAAVDASVGGGSGGGIAGGAGGGVGGGSGGGSPTCQGCPPWTRCIADFDGGRCDGTGVALSWLTPDASAALRVRPDASVSLALAVQNLAADVPWRIVDGGTANGTLLFANGYVGSLAAPSAVTDTIVTLIAGWEDGGPTAITSFVVDVTPPLVTLLIQDWFPPPNSRWSPLNAWRRDETVLVAVVANEPQVASLTLADGGAGVVSNLALSTCRGVAGLSTCTSGNNCSCFGLQLWRPLLNGLEANWGLVTSASDQAGNAGLADASIAVTRRRWVADLASMHTSAALALDNHGMIYVGTKDLPGPNGRIVALRPDGWTAWSSDVGAVESLSYAEDQGVGYVYYAANTPGGARIGTLFAADGGTGPQRPCGSAASRVRCGIALLDAGAGLLGAVGVVEGFEAMDASSSLCLHSAVSGAWHSDGGSYLDMQSPIGGQTTATNVVVSNNTAWFPAGGAMRRYDFDRLTGWPADTSPSIGNQVVGFSNAVSGVLLLPEQNRLLASTDSANLSIGGLYIIDGTALTFLSIPLSAMTYGPAMRTASEAIAPSAPGVLTFFAPEDGGVNGVVTTAGFMSSPPVVGVGDYIYTVSRAATFGVLKGGQREWNADPFVGQYAWSPPALDCVRGLNGDGLSDAGVGVFYMVTETGRVAAILVDSPRLSDASPWPKYQRDAYNSGNPTLGLSLNPGCP